MHIQTQFSVFMVNKPGVLAQVLNEIARAKVNLIAITMMDSVEHGVMRLVGRSPERIRNVLKGLNMPFSETEVLCVTLSNRAGALADITQKLAQAHINISYAYCTAGAKGGKTTGVLKVADVKKTMKILSSHADRAGKSKPTVRRSPASRK
ncbi:MAG TPA: ACT domain-containing protein [Planctomycetes bacterium]|nr:ACT domain-containing protein [Planctomycetota bacterium]HIJ71651.1 ACT domain-containing protein [Planctomycetota bacterium]